MQDYQQLEHTLKENPARVVFRAVLEDGEDVRVFTYHESTETFGVWASQAHPEGAAALTDAAYERFAARCEEVMAETYGMAEHRHYPSTNRTYND